MESDLNLEIEVNLKEILPDGVIKEHKASFMSIDSAQEWFGRMERMLLKEATEQEIATELAKDDF